MTGVVVSNLPMFAAQYPTLLRASTGRDVESCRDLPAEMLSKLFAGDTRI